MKKFAKIGLGVLATGVVFGAGLLASDYTKATTDWKTNAINQANSSMGESAYNEKSKLISGADADIQSTVIEKLSIEDRQKELQRLLDEYYDLKIQGLTGSQSFKDLEAQINAIQSDILTRYKKEIDQVFVNTTN
jgi:hypothetical protein